MKTQQFDIHLSAEAISPKTVDSLEESGFKKDFFQNNRNSKPPHYHASFRTHFNEPDDALWQRTVVLLTSDPNFRGCLEEEVFNGELRYHFDSHDLSSGASVSITPFVLQTCEPCEHKGCDIHINIDLQATRPEALGRMEEFNFISFEREVDGVMRRIYSLTFGNIRHGERVFHRLHELFQIIPGLVGKMKLEKVTRFMVHPDDAGQLPIIRDANAEAWLIS